MNMEEKFEIIGGKPLKGEIEVRGAKNAAFPILSAVLLTDEECFIDNLPLIEDVFRMLELLKSLGCQIEWLNKRKIKIQAKNLNLDRVDKKTIGRFRGSILLYGSLLARVGKIELPEPGGCLLGARPIDTHLDAFSQMGVEISFKKGELLMRRKKILKNNLEVMLEEFSVTGTANPLLLAASFPLTTIIKIADQDYQIQELLKVLRKMGVKIKKIGHHTITLLGKKKLKGFSHRIIADPLEAGTFITLAAATKSYLTIKNVEFEFLGLFLKKLKKAGLPLEILLKEKIVKVKPFKKLVLRKIQSLPFPGIHSDLLSVLAVLATQATGPTLIQDPLYEGRFKYLEEINRMGAKIYFADPHRVIIQGPTLLFGRDLGSIDIRGGAALVIAALIAKGKSTISNIYQIDRGYEKIEKRLQKIGAKIKRIT
jgi:UDP-N-acetylglucosamine 1-carboxyvinyltransferase